MNISSILQQHIRLHFYACVYAFTGIPVDGMLDGEQRNIIVFLFYCVFCFTNYIFTLITVLHARRLGRDFCKFFFMLSNYMKHVHIYMCTYVYVKTYKDYINDALKTCY